MAHAPVFDPWTKQDLEVQGVWLADVLQVARADEEARSLHLAALDAARAPAVGGDHRAAGRHSVVADGGR
ncbi:MAG TPA: hypothetical protein VNO83_07220 [Pseudonocardia sp.]|nr:hypothetical protein [Pseudonocardia sp.]